MQESQPQQTAAATPIWRDLLIPGSIIVAGAAIGLGLYFNGGTTAPAPTYEQVAVEAADQTDQVAEVTDQDHRKGSTDASITIVEYSDFDCPFCSRFHEAMDELVASDDDVAWVYRHFPLEQLHPQAEAVALASECVADIAGESAFWTFTDGYFAVRGAQDGTPHDILVPRLAGEAGVTASALNECLTSGRTQAKVQADIDNAIATGGRGTPWSIVIGPTGKTYPINGALPAAAIRQVIQVARDEA
jgi:protein-disulfide isomerase